MTRCAQRNMSQPGTILHIPSQQWRLWLPSANLFVHWQLESLTACTERRLGGLSDTGEAGHAAEQAANVQPRSRVPAGGAAEHRELAAAAGGARAAVDALEPAPDGNGAAELSQCVSPGSCNYSSLLYHYFITLIVCFHHVSSPSCQLTVHDPVKRRAAATPHARAHVQ